VSEDTKQGEEQDREAEAEQPEPASPADAATAAEDERPYFARAYPRDPALEVLIEAFDRGNYAKVRTDARALADRSTDPAVKGAAEDLLRRIQPDSLSTALVVLGIGLLLFLAYSYLGHPPHEVTP
jgi:hypothetical protein